MQLRSGQVPLTRWHVDQSGRWIYRLIPELATWLDRKHGQVGFYLALALSGHGCFNAYLKRFNKRDDEGCDTRGYRSGSNAQLTSDTMISIMLQPEEKWILIVSFVTLVMKTRELDGLAERGNNEGQ